jgi:hypothetical protein
MTKKATKKVRESIMISEKAQLKAEKIAKEQDRTKHYVLSQIIENQLGK